MTSPGHVFLNYSQTELDAQYDQRTLVPDIGPYVRRYKDDTDDARRRLQALIDLPYGESAAERLDIYPPAAPGAPILVFLHGGAWRQLDSADSGFAAPTFVQAGAMFVAPNFGLVPDVTLDEQVRQCRAAIAWVAANAGRYGGDADRIFVCGHSSGAHVAAMVAAASWPDVTRPRTMAGAALISGIYDLAPVRLSARNDYLHLDEPAGRRNSPTCHLPPEDMPVLLAVGGGELAEFQRQARDFARRLKQSGRPCRLIERPGLNHFDMSLELCDPSSAVARAMLDMMALTAA